MDDILDSRIEISPDVLFQEISGETVLLDLRSESYFGLDPTATRIWQLLQDKHGLPELCEIMLAEFDVGPEELREDLVQHLNELREAGLIIVTRRDSD